jgi:hypothetical protein
MVDYKQIYKWMIIPMVVMQLGIFMDYWGDFSENAWSVHTHYWVATVWYLFLIFQPYLATHGQIERHRTYGIIGMFLAGGVCVTAFSMLYRDVDSSIKAAQFPERFGPFEPWFFFGIVVVEFVMIVAFGYAVIQSILHRKEIANHSWWLMSTVFIIMMPALARGLGFVQFTLYADQLPNVNIMIPAYLCQTMIIGLLLLFAWTFGTLKHPATYLALAVNAFVFLLEPIGRSESVQWFLKAVIKG